MHVRCYIEESSSPIHITIYKEYAVALKATQQLLLRNSSVCGNSNHGHAQREDMKPGARLWLIQLPACVK